MIDMLVRATQNGVIERTYFVAPSQLYKPNSIYAFFDDETKQALEDALQNHNAAFIEGFVNSKKHVIYLSPFGNRWFIYVTHQSITDEQQVVIKNILDNFSTYYEAGFKDELVEKQFFYDSIQKLNNRLINETREKEKLNKRLNQANMILNNRLVKDPLTHLVSRYQYRDEMQHAINSNPKQQGLFIFIDLDNFKGINDTYGHTFGDKYLVMFSKRLKHAFDADVVIRIAGDEFGVFIYPYEVNQTSIEQVDERLKAISKPIEIDGKMYHLAFSAGVAVYPDDAEDIHLLIDYSDYAMYEAKKTAKIMKCFNIETYKANKGLKE